MVMICLVSYFHMLAAIIIVFNGSQRCMARMDSKEHLIHGEEVKKWKGVCNTGRRQSPVDIRKADVDIAGLPPLKFAPTDASGDLNITNNGHTLIVTGFEKWGKKRPYIEGSGLKKIYNLVQFHLHWSLLNDTGSEHTVENVYYPGEIHFVHIEKGRSFDDGKPLENDSIAVVAAFLAFGKDGSAFAPVAAQFPKLVIKESQKVLRGISLRKLLPHNLEIFYRYYGSLTTPTCDESVVWTVFADPVTITPQQMDKLRQIKFASGKVGENYRPVHPLNGRRIQLRSPNGKCTSASEPGVSELLKCSANSAAENVSSVPNANGTAARSISNRRSLYPMIGACVCAALFQSAPSTFSLDL